MIEIKNVNFTYNGDKAGGGLKNIDLTIQNGEIILLTGASGCGKTTVTRLINGLIPHYYEGALSGEVLIDGKNIVDMEMHESTRYSGSVFQNPRAQFFAVDTDSEMSFECENYGMPENEILECVENTTREFNVGALRHRDIFLLSGGEKQKIACASVSVDGPEILILDEPTSGLDPFSRDELLDVLRILKGHGVTIFFSTHITSDLEKCADNIIYMSNGEIKADCAKADFINNHGRSRETLEEVFLRMEKEVRS